MRLRLILDRESGGGDVFDSMQVEVDMDELSLADVEYEDNLDNLDDVDEEEDPCGSWFKDSENVKIEIILTL